MTPTEPVHERTYDRLLVEVYSSPAALGEASARDFAIPVFARLCASV